MHDYTGANSQSNLNNSIRSNQSHRNLLQNTSDGGLAFYKYKNDELSKDLFEKTSIIKQQQEKINTLQQELDNYIGNTHSLNEKISLQDTLTIELNSLKNKQHELECHVTYINKEKSQLQDIINSRDCVINEFQSLVSLSTDKFKLFDEMNSNLKQKLKKSEHNNTQLKGRVKQLEDMIANERLRSEQAERKLTEIDLVVQEKEKEILCKIKEKEIERSKLSTKLRELERDLKQIEECCNEKNNEIDNLNSIIQDLNAGIGRNIMAQSSMPNIDFLQHRIQILEQDKSSLLKEFVCKEEKYINDIRQLQRVIVLRDQERECMKVKYEKKIQMLKLRMDEMEKMLRESYQ